MAQISLLQMAKNKARALNSSGFSGFYIEEDVCSEKHYCIVLRREGVKGGLVLVHQGSTFDEKKARRAITLLSATFVRKHSKVFEVDDWSWLVIFERQGQEILFVAPAIPHWLVKASNFLSGAFRFLRGNKS